MNSSSQQDFRIKKEQSISKRQNSNKQSTDDDIIIRNSQQQQKNQSKKNSANANANLNLNEQLDNFKVQTKNEKKYHRRKKTDINDKPYKCGCSKEFNDYSSLYTHIKTNHDLQIPENTVLPQLKKKDVMQFLKDQKGDAVESSEFDIEINYDILFYLDQEELLNSFLKFEDVIMNNQDLQISEYFHPEDSGYFCLEECQMIKNQYSELQPLLENKNALFLTGEYLKPFTQKTGIEMTYALNNLFKLYLDFKMQQNEDTYISRKKCLEIVEQFWQKYYLADKQQYINLGKLQDDLLLEYFRSFFYYFINALEKLPSYQEQVQQNQSQNQDKSNQQFQSGKLLLKQQSNIQNQNSGNNQNNNQNQNQASINQNNENNNNQSLIFNNSNNCNNNEEAFEMMIKKHKFSNDFIKTQFNQQENNINNSDVVGNFYQGGNFNQLNNNSGNNNQQQQQQYYINNNFLLGEGHQQQQSQNQQQFINQIKMSENSGNLYNGLLQGLLQMPNQLESQIQGGDQYNKINKF